MQGWLETGARKNHEVSAADHADRAAGRRGSRLHGIDPGRRLDPGWTGERPERSRRPERPCRPGRHQPDAGHGQHGRRHRHPADQAHQPGHARRSQRRRTDGAAAADQPRVQQHRPRPAGRDHEARGHVPVGSRRRVPVPPRRRGDRRRLREHQRRGRGDGHRRRQQDPDAGPLHGRRGRLRPRLHHEVRPARLPPPAGPAGGRPPVRPVPGRPRQPDDELPGGRRAADRGHAAVAGVPVPLGARLREPAGRGQGHPPQPLRERQPPVVLPVGHDARRRPVHRRPGRQAGHAGRDRSAGQAHADRPQGARDRHRLRRLVAEPGSGDQPPEGPDGVPRVAGQPEERHGRRGEVVPHQRGVRGRRQVRQPADGHQLVRQRPAGRRCTGPLASPARR